MVPIVKKANGYPRQICLICTGVISHAIYPPYNL